MMLKRDLTVYLTVFCSSYWLPNSPLIDTEEKNITAAHCVSTAFYLSLFLLSGGKNTLNVKSGVMFT